MEIKKISDTHWQVGTKDIRFYIGDNIRCPIGWYVDHGYDALGWMNIHPAFNTALEEAMELTTHP